MTLVGKISTKINAKTGTKIEKFVQRNMWNDKTGVATVVTYGEKTPMKLKYGIDRMVHDPVTLLADKALMRGDEILLNGSTKPSEMSYFGDFKALAKDLFAKLNAGEKVKPLNHSTNDGCYNGFWKFPDSYALKKV